MHTPQRRRPQHGQLLAECAWERSAAARLARSRRRPAKSGPGPCGTSYQPARCMPCGYLSLCIPAAPFPRAPRPCGVTAPTGCARQDGRVTHGIEPHQFRAEAQAELAGDDESIWRAARLRRPRAHPLCRRSGRAGAPAMSSRPASLRAHWAKSRTSEQPTRRAGGSDRDPRERAWTAVALDLYLPPSRAARFNAPRDKPPVCASAPASPRIKARTERTRLTYWTRLPAQRQITTMISREPSWGGHGGSRAAQHARPHTSTADA